MLGKRPSEECTVTKIWWAKLLDFSFFQSVLKCLEFFISYGKLYFLKAAECELKYVWYLLNTHPTFLLNTIMLEKKNQLWGKMKNRIKPLVTPLICKFQGPNTFDNIVKQLAVTLVSELDKYNCDEYFVLFPFSPSPLLQGWIKPCLNAKVTGVGFEVFKKK